MSVRFRSFVPADMVTVRQHMPYALTEATAGVVAYDDVSHETWAILLAENWTATSVTVHQVIIKPMVLRRGWFETIADYLFTRAARKKLYGLVPSNNWRALSLNEKAGFVEVARLEDAYADGVDYVIMELRRENCPFWQAPPLQKVS